MERGKGGLHIGSVAILALYDVSTVNTNRMILAIHTLPPTPKLANNPAFRLLGKFIPQINFSGASQHTKSVAIFNAAIVNWIGKKPEQNFNL